MSIKFNYLNILFGIVAFLGIVQFGFSLQKAISLYPGNYSISKHFLSDLGRWQTPEGKFNREGSYHFNLGIRILGISLLPFFCAIQISAARLRRTIRIAGAAACIGLFGIGLTPWDAYPVLHIVALAIWLTAMCAMICTFFFYAYYQQKYVIPSAVFALLALIVAGAYVFAGNLTAIVVFQKLLVVLSVIWFCFVFVLVSFETIHHTFSSRKAMLDETAREYLKELEQGHRR